MLNFRTLTNLVGALLLLPGLVLADAICDGTDDIFTSGIASSNFMTASTGSMALWYKPTGTASAGFGSPDCYPGEHLMGDNLHAGINRNGNLSGNDRLCIWNDDGGGLDHIPTTYTVNVWTHLVWVHTGGNILFYKDGALVSSTASGDSNLSSTFQFCDGTAASAAMGEGVIGEAATFTTALSANEIAALAGSHLRRIASSAPSAYWELGSCGDGASCDTGTFADRSGNGRNLTATGGTGAAAAYLTFPWGVE